MRTLPIKSLLAVAAALLLVLFAPAAKAKNGVDQSNQKVAEGYGQDAGRNVGHESNQGQVTPGPDRRYEGDGNRGRQSNRVWVDPYRKCYYPEGSPRFGHTRGGSYMSERQALKHNFHLAADWNTGNRGRHEERR